MKSFGAQIDDWVKKSNNRMDAVFKTAAQDLTREVTTPRARGGRMPVDTGFLINSLLVGVNDVPRGASRRTTEPVRDQFDNMASAAAVINSATLGDKLIFGFTANYALYQETKNGFVRLNCQLWNQIVAKAMAKVKREFA